MSFLKRPLPLLVLFACLHGLLYAALTPPWQAPDETAHFEYSHLLAVNWRPLTAADASPALEQQMIASLYRFHAWHYLNQVDPKVVPDRLAQAPFYSRSRTLDRFSLAYVPYALAVWPFLGQSVEFQLYVMRLVSVLTGVLVVVLTYKTARLVEPSSHALAVGAALFVILLPQHSYILASISDGNLAELLGSVAIYFLVKMYQDDFSWRRLTICVLSIAGAVLTKATSYFLIPLGLLVFLVLALRWARVARRQPVAVGRRPALLALVVIGVVLLPALQFLRFQVFTKARLSQLQIIANNFLHLGKYMSHVVQIIVDQTMWRAITGTYQSFWATFGWMVVYLPSAWYGWIGALATLALLGWGLQIFRRPPFAGLSNKYGVLGLAALLPIAVLLGFFLLAPRGTNAYQGRYVFGGMVPIAVLLVRGWLFWAPARRANWVVALIALGMGLLDVAALLVVFVPYFAH